MLNYLKKSYHIFSEPYAVFLHTEIVNKQRLLLTNPTIVTKLQFISIKTEPLYIGRQKKRRHLMKMIRE